MVPRITVVKDYVNWLWTVGVENQPALIFLNEVDTLFRMGDSGKLT